MQDFILPLQALYNRVRNITHEIPKAFAPGKVTIKTGEKITSSTTPGTPSVVGFGGSPTVEQMSRQIIVGTMTTLQPGQKPYWAYDPSLEITLDDNGNVL